MEINREALKSAIRIKRKKLFQVFSYAAMTLATVFFITNFVFHLDKLYVRQVVISGNKQVEDGPIFSVVQTSLNGRYYGMYPRNNVLIYPKEHIAKSLLRNIPQLATVALSGNVNTLLVEVTEREPRYLWCDDALKPLIERACYYLDENGFAFQEAPGFSDHMYLEFYGGNKRGGYMIRSVLKPEELRFVVDAKNSAEKVIKDRGINLGDIYGINVYNNGDYDLMLSDNKRNWKIIIGSNTDVPKKLAAVLDSPFFLRELRDQANRIEYIDLRFGKKVFYKFNK